MVEDVGYTTPVPSTPEPPSATELPTKATDASRTRASRTRASRTRAARTREARKIAAGITLAALYPDVARGWAADLNGKPACAVLPLSNQSAWWRCPCGSVFLAIIANRTRTRSTLCPSCGRRAASETRARRKHEAGENLAVLYPSIAAELLGEPGAGGVSPNSHAPREWACAQCGHVYVSTPATRTRDRGTTSSRGCPSCFGSQRRVRNQERVSALLRQGHCLARTHPGLALEWHPSNVLTPDQVTPGSSVHVLWRGTCGHEWEDRVGARTNRKDPRGCPVCAGQAVSADRNFQACFPALAAEWSPRNLRGPETYAPRSNRLAWWQCSKPSCGNEWEMAIGVRVAGSGCPRCSLGRRSSVEVRVVFELAHFLPDVQPGRATSISAGGRVLYPDAILSRDLGILFEYDGRRYHPDEQRDRERRSALEQAGWQVVAARERPLPLLGELCFPVDGGRAWRKPHEVAQAVLRVLRDQCGMEMGPPVEAYLHQSSPVARDQADRFLLSRRRRKGRGGST